MLIRKVEEKNRGLYTVDGTLHPRRDLHLVNGNIIKAPTKWYQTKPKKHAIQKIK